jgi:LysR family glycine cleavage system transcriptional activator
MRFMVTAIDGVPDFGEANLDLALHYGPAPDAEGVHGRPLGEEVLRLVGRPGTAPDARRIGHPLDPEAAGPFMADAGLALEAAVAGLGAALVPGLLAGAALADGRLVELEAALPAPFQWWLSAPAPQWRQAKVRALVAFLLGE